jgi:predicted nucleic acid-binding protein
MIARLDSHQLNPDHEFWPIDIDLTVSDSIMKKRLIGLGQVTDLQLLLLAHKHGGQLATLDTGIRELAAGTRYASSVIQI